MPTRARLRTLLVAGLGTPALLLALPVLAHHGFAQYDFSKQLEMQGTVQSFEFGQPHSWLTISVTGKDDAHIWKILMGNPPELTRLGIRPASFKAGDRISVTIHPARAGTGEGALISARGADGHSIGVMPAGLELLPPEVRVKKAGE